MLSSEVKLDMRVQNQSHEKSLRIAMLGHKRIPSREGGVEVVVEELATRMAKQGHAVTCYNRKGHHIAGENFDAQKADASASYKGISLKKVWTINRKGLAAMTSSFFAAVAAAFGHYDVVHFHAEGPCAMLWLPKLCGKRCIGTVHGLDHQRAKWGKLAKAYIMLGEKVAVRFADEIIVLSQGVQDYFEEIYGRETVFIPNGVNSGDVQEANLILRKYGLDEDEYILYLGRIVPEKGLHYLVSAFKETKTDKKLVIAGSASDTDEYFSKIKQMASTDKRIIFTGFVQGKMLNELYSNAYVYILPSDLEGMPLSLLEAMSYNNCCIVSDIAECAEVVEDKALVFEKSNVESIRGLLQACCDSPALVQEYKQCSADFICEKYNWDEVTEQTLCLYQDSHVDDSAKVAKNDEK